MNKLTCKSCGGPLNTAYTRCRYCGQSIMVNRILSGEEKKRLMVFASVMDNYLWTNTFSLKLFISCIFVFFNVMLMFIVVLLIYNFSGSIILPMAVLLLMSGKMAASYHSIFWFVIFYQPVMKKVYNDKIEPSIEHFLKCYNYSGCELQKIIHEMKLDLKEVVPSPVDHENQTDKISSFTKNLISSIGDGLYRRQSRFIIIIIFTAAYLILLTIPLYLFLFPDRWEWIPFLWVIPLYVYMTLKLTDKLPANFDIFEYNIFSGPDKKFLNKEILPLIGEYCEFTKTEYPEIIAHVYEPYRTILGDLLTSELTNNRKL